MLVASCQVYLREGEALEGRVAAALSHIPGLSIEEKQSLVLTVLRSPVVVEGAERLSASMSAFRSWSQEVRRVVGGRRATMAQVQEMLRRVVWRALWGLKVWDSVVGRRAGRWRWAAPRLGGWKVW